MKEIIHFAVTLWNVANGLLHPKCVSVSNHIFEELEDNAHDALAGDGADGEVAASPTGRGHWLRIVGLLLGAYGIFWLGTWAENRSSKPPLVGPISAQSAAAPTPKVMVHVTGRVHRPGVYTLGADARVQDAVRRAGGPLPDADVSALNLASWAEDGTRIAVPAKPKPAATPSARIVETPALEESFAAEDEPAPAVTDVERTTATTTRLLSSTTRPSTRTVPRRSAAEAKKATKPKAAKSTTIAGMPRALTAAGKPSDNASPEFLEKHPLNLNSANAAQLEALPGVGPAMAQKILDYRKQNGGFKSVDQLEEVPGIGPKKMETLRPLVDVN